MSDNREVVGQELIFDTLPASDISCVGIIDTITVDACTWHKLWDTAASPKSFDAKLKFNARLNTPDGTEVEVGQMLRFFYVPTATFSVDWVGFVHLGEVIPAVSNYYWTTRLTDYRFTYKRQVGGDLYCGNKVFTYSDYTTIAADSRVPSRLEARFGKNFKAIFYDSVTGLKDWEHALVISDNSGVLTLTLEAPCNKTTNIAALLPVGVDPYEWYAGASDDYLSIKLIEKPDTTLAGVTTGGGTNYLDDTTESDFRAWVEFGQEVTIDTPARVCTVKARTATRLTFNETATAIGVGANYTVFLPSRSSNYYPLYNYTFVGWKPIRTVDNGNGTGSYILLEQQYANFIYAFNLQVTTYAYGNDNPLGFSSSFQHAHPVTGVVVESWSATVYDTGYEDAGGAVRVSKSASDWVCWLPTYGVPGEGAWVPFGPAYEVSPGNWVETLYNDEYTFSAAQVGDKFISTRGSAPAFSITIS